MRPLLRLGAREAEVETMKVDVLVDGAGAVERVVLGHDAHRRAAPAPAMRTTSTPAISTRPQVGRARVVQMLMVVVLPAPLGPSRPIQLALAHTQLDAIHGYDALFAFVDLAKALYLNND